MQCQRLAFPGSLILLLFLISHDVIAQQASLPDTLPDPYHKIVVPGKQYEAGGFKSMLWGRHYRKEWTTPVKVQVFKIDSVFGGLKPESKGGGRQTMNLKLENEQGKEYVLRSIDKHFSQALPDIFLGTFVEDIANDQVSIAHPFAAVTIPRMAEAAGIYHTNPIVGYLPHSSSLGEFDNDYGNNLYLLEERPDDNQSDAPNFGYSRQLISTDSMMQQVLSSNRNRVDQAMLVRCRLFDMFIGDWGRHEDQWRWAEFKAGDELIYRPVPRDRDQSYTLFDGLLVSLGKSAIQYGVESFDKKIDDIRQFNFPARYLDRRFTNETTLDTWLGIANDLKLKLTDQVIEEAVHDLPPELYGISGKTIEENLKSRRDSLDAYARKYYLFLAKAVDIPGTKSNDWFEVSYDGDGNVSVHLYEINSDNTKGVLHYSRNFRKEETKEIRIYGISGNDHFSAAAAHSNAIKLRFIGGMDHDIYQAAAGKGVSKPLVYDDSNNDFQNKQAFRLRLSGDSSVHEYDYKGFSYDKHGVKKVLFYNNRDRIYIGTGYYIQKSKWRKSPFGYRHDLNLNYSIWQNAFSVEYKGLVKQAIAGWDLALYGDYDGVRDFQFSGVGNETINDGAIRGFYRARTREFHGDIGLVKNFQSVHQLGVHAFYQGIKLLHEKDKFVSVLSPDNEIFNHKDYVGVRAEYNFIKLNDPVLPTKGSAFLTEVSYTHPFESGRNAFYRFTGTAGVYIPIARRLTLVTKVLAATNTETTDFYQSNRLGGAATFRGYPRYRFYGKSAFLNSNELQFAFKVRSHIMNGTAGIIGFFDNGRVWQPGEISNTWHTGYGGGIMLAPFDKIVVAATYGFTREANRINLRLGRML